MGVTREILEDKMVSLGEAIDLFRNGQKLSIEQLMLLNDATDKQIRIAFMMRSASTLKGQEYTNYCHNVRMLSKMKKK